MGSTPKYWFSSLYTLFSKTAFFLINSCIFSCFFGHFGYKWVIFLIRKSLQNKAFMSYLCIFLGLQTGFFQFFVVLLSCMLHVLFPVKCNHFVIVKVAVMLHSKRQTTSIAACPCNHKEKLFVSFCSIK